MTSFVAWIGVDPRGPASIYFASDSRISFPNTASSPWNSGRKLYSCKNSPEIFGYVGDVLFTSQVLSQIVDMIDCGQFFADGISLEQKARIVKNQLESLLQSAPSHMRRKITVAYATKENHSKYPKFLFSKFAWDGQKWFEECIPIPKKSSALWIGGSGEPSVQIWQDKWQASSVGGTSRAVFSAFCDALESSGDPYTGGAPQLVGLYRNGNGRTFGTVYKGERFLLGQLVRKEPGEVPSSVEWRNENFEICTEHGNRDTDAQRQPTPNDLEKK